MLDVITDNLDIWTTAQKQKKAVGRGSAKKEQGYGIKKLRELILELAVRGKLVPQDPKDEPASVLLEKIAEEKQRLIDEGKIKKQKVLPEIGEDEQLFNLSEGWCWVRLGNAGISSTGKTPSTKEPRFFDGKIPFIGPGQITPDGKLIDPEKYLSEDGVVNSMEASHGDILMVCIGGSIGKSVICDKRIAFNQQINAIKPMLVLSRYLLISVSTNMFYQSVLEKSSGSATPIINRTKWDALLVPLPPLAEQHRIVAKVDELMSLCDQLEQEQADHQATHQTLVKTLLNGLTLRQAQGDRNNTSSTVSPELVEGHASTAPSEFEQAWNLIEKNFDTLFTTEDSIDQLKQTILQLAVMGKLVPQNPKDEPASVLLEEIAKEKAKLIKEGKIKKQKALPEITEDEKPFGLPEGWEWSNLQNLLALVTDGDHQAPPKSDDGIPFLVIGNLNQGVVSFDNCRYVPISYYQKLDWSRQPSNGDILYTVTGSYGIPIPVNVTKNFCVQRHVAILKATKFSPVEYLSLVLTAKYAFEYATKIATGIAQKTVPLTGLRKMPIPVAPREEQHRIVTKVNQLLNLCDTLKANLNQAQTTQTQLADTIVKQAVN